jgi:uncharacterized phage protein (TIGR02218 family)
MKPASSALISYLNAVIAGAQQLYQADAYVFTLYDGSTLCYTNLDAGFAFSYNSNNYTAIVNSILIDGLKYKSALGLENDQQQITISAAATDTIPGGVAVLQALRDGAFDLARIIRYRVFFSDRVGGTAVGAVILFQGRVGPISKLDRLTATVSVNSDLVLLDTSMPRNIYQASCLHTLYDSGCTLNKASFGTNGTAAAGSTVSTIKWSGASTNFQQGSITFTSGMNDGVTATVGSAVNGQSLSLIYPLDNAPAAGDTFTVYFGCDHTPATCQNKFNNFANFRGFPYVPPPNMAI